MSKKDINALKRLPHILLPYMLQAHEFVHEAIVASLKDERRTKKSVETRKVLCPWLRRLWLSREVLISR